MKRAGLKKRSIGSSSASIREGPSYRRQDGALSTSALRAIMRRNRAEFMTRRPAGLRLAQQSSIVPQIADPGEGSQVLGRQG
jgi:hypothetical protein